MFKAENIKFYLMILPASFIKLKRYQRKHYCLNPHMQPSKTVLYWHEYQSCTETQGSVMTPSLIWLQILVRSLWFRNKKQEKNVPEKQSRFHMCGSYGRPEQENQPRGFHKKSMIATQTHAQIRRSKKGPSLVL